MIYILENDVLKVKISSMGAELQSIQRKEDGTEYLWQGDPQYWKDRSPVLFPICGRLIEGRYTYKGQSYDMTIHGFAKAQEWTVLRQKADVLTLQLQDNEQTRQMYPFRFAMEITFTLENDSLTVAMVVRNLDEQTLIFSVGGHPGFNVPLCPEERFEDYYLAFDEPCEARKLCLSDTCFYLNCSEPFPLEDGQFLPLRHDLFDHDAIFLRDTCNGVTLRTAEGKHSVHVSYPDMPYLGLWHRPRTDAPYVCIEPWNGVPSLDGQVDDLETKIDCEHLEPGKAYRNVYTITLG